MKSKAQTSVEFAVLLGFMFILFLLFLKIVQDRAIEAEYVNERQNLKEVTSIFSNELRNANSFQPGYTRTFEMPRQINGRNYTVEVWNNNETVAFLVNQRYIDFLDVNVEFPVWRIEDGINKSNLTIGTNTICKVLDGTREVIRINNC